MSGPTLGQLITAQECLDRLICAGEDGEVRLADREDGLLRDAYLVLEDLRGRVAEANHHGAVRS